MIATLLSTRIDSKDPIRAVAKGITYLNAGAAPEATFAGRSEATARPAACGGTDAAGSRPTLEANRGTLVASRSLGECTVELHLLKQTRHSPPSSRGSSRTEQTLGLPLPPPR